MNQVYKNNEEEIFSPPSNLNHTTQAVPRRSMPADTHQAHEKPPEPYSHTKPTASQGQGRQRRVDTSSNERCTSLNERRAQAEFQSKAHQQLFLQNQMDSSNNNMHDSHTNICDKCGSPTRKSQPPRIGRKQPQLNNQSFTQNALDRSEILQAAFVGQNMHNQSRHSSIVGYHHRDESRNGLDQF